MAVILETMSIILGMEWNKTKFQPLITKKGFYKFNQRIVASYNANNALEKML